MGPEKSVRRHSLDASRQAVRRDDKASNGELDCRPDREMFIFPGLGYHFMEQPGKKNGRSHFVSDIQAGVGRQQSLHSAALHYLIHTVIS